MPKAFGQKLHYDDHDSDVVDEQPPVQNTWYEVFDAEDVRLLLCVVRQDNDETVGKDVEIRWTIDGNVYFISVTLASGTAYYTFRTYFPSAGGTGGLNVSSTIFNAVRYVGKRGKTFKVEVRITSALGTNQRLRAWCVRETLDLT